MSDGSTDAPDKYSADFMLAEYERLTGAFQSTEESGERPVNFFIALATAVSGTFLVLLEEKVLTSPWVVAIGLGVLLVFGVSTLVRIIKRNITSHEYLRAAARIRAYFAKQDKGILDYLYYPAADDWPFRKKEWHQVLSVGTGGVLEHVSLVNSLLVAGIFGLAAYSILGVPAGLLFGFEGAIGAWICQFIYVKGRYEREERKERAMSKFPIEMEIALIICSERPEATADEVGNLKSVGSYELLPGQDRTIRDLYFDTLERALERRRIALRVRSLDRQLLLTLKGPSRPAEGGVMERLEIEAPWSSESLVRALRELALRGVVITGRPDSFSRAEPVTVLADLGLKVVQDRTTWRRTKNIAAISKVDTTVLAELAIDHVTYHFEQQNVRLWELEIEAKGRDGAEAVRVASDRLLARFDTALRQWDHGKVATGKAIEQLLSERALQDLIEDDGTLKQSGYARIDALLRQAAI